MVELQLAVTKYYYNTAPDTFDTLLASLFMDLVNKRCTVTVPKSVLGAIVAEIQDKYPDYYKVKKVADSKIQFVISFTTFSSCNLAALDFPTSLNFLLGKHLDATPEKQKVCHHTVSIYSDGTASAVY